MLLAASQHREREGNTKRITHKKTPRIRAETPNRVTERQTTAVHVWRITTTTTTTTTTSGICGMAALHSRHIDM